MAIIQNLYQLVKSLLFVFLVNEKQHGGSRKRQSAKLITPPLTPDTVTSFQQQEQQQPTVGMWACYHVTNATI